MTRHAVIIAGGGPTGMMLAGELALAGVDVAIVERLEVKGPLRVAAGDAQPRAALEQRLRDMVADEPATAEQHHELSFERSVRSHA